MWPNTPIWRILRYIAKLPELMRQQKTMLIIAAQFPWLNEADQKKVLGGDATMANVEPMKLSEMKSMAAALQMNVIED